MARIATLYLADVQAADKQYLYVVCKVFRFNRVLLLNFNLKN